MTSLIFKFNQSEEDCLKAVKENGLSLQYVLNKTPKITLEAIKQNPEAKQYMSIDCFLQKATDDEIKQYYILPKIVNKIRN
jgi:hypothetical protein